MPAKSLDVKSITKRYDSKKNVLDGISFSAKQGEFVVLVGPSGCGKSTLLRCIAGLEAANEGSVLIGERDVTSLAPKDRNVAMVFQDYALYPHMSVYDNIAFGLRMRKLTNQEIDTKVRAAAEKLSIAKYLDRKPAALSGGQRQRVAIGRAIVRDPDVFLFDEPLSNLDAKLRASMRVTISKLHKELKATVVYVTHDQVEAMTLADTIIVLASGRIQQMGPPLQLYYHPVNLFVAQFIGSPQMNLIEGKLELKNGIGKVHCDNGLTIELGTRHSPLLNNSVRDGMQVVWGVRPENLRLVSADTDPAYMRFKATVVMTEPLGSMSIVVCEVLGHEVCVSLPEPHRPKVGDILDLAWTSKHLYLFDKETELTLERPKE